MCSSCNFLHRFDKYTCIKKQILIWIDEMCLTKQKEAKRYQLFWNKKNVHDLWHQVDNDKDGDSMIFT